MTKNILFNEQLEDYISSGVKKVVDVVKETYGPGGKNVIIYNEERGSYTITKDGVTACNSVNLAGLEKIGSDIVKNASNKTNKEVGDGTTSTSILTNALINEFKDFKKYPKFKTELEDIRDLLLQYLSEIKLDVTTNLRDVINISTNNDREITDNVYNAYQQCGSSYNIITKPSTKMYTEVETLDGVYLKNGVFDVRYFNQKEKYCQEDGIICLYSKKIDNMNMIQNIVTNAVITRKKPLLILTPDIDIEISKYLHINNANKTIDVCVVKIPFYGDAQKQYIESLSALLNVKPCDSGVVESNTFKTYDYVDISKTESKLSLKFVNNPDKINEIKSYIESKLSDSPDEVTKNNLLANMELLSGKLTTIKVGGNSLEEVHEKIDRYTDSICAANVALKTGILPGGCRSFELCSKFLKEYDYTDTKYNRKVAMALSLALNHPLHVLMENNNSTSELNYIYNYTWSENGENYIDKGLIDPYGVIQSVIKNSIDAYSIFATSSCIVYNEN